MSYQVLARKYRPQTFEEVVGQKPIVATLQNAVAQKRVHHAYLFSGLRGVGKTTVARLMAKALNCRTGPTATPCNACPACTEIAECRAIDVLEIDGASNRGIEAVRELRETARYAPARDRHKIFIIDEVHMLTPEAWNALLKTVEEPPPHVVFLFATTDYRKIPLTILSRCQHFEFRKIGPAEMARHLRKVAEGEGVTVPETVLGLIVRMAEGSLRDAQSALDQVIAFSGDTITEEQARAVLGVIDRDLIHGFYDAVRAGDCARLVAIVDTVFENGYQAVQFLEDLMAHGRDLLLVRAVPEAGRHLPGGEEEARDLAASAAGFGEDDLLRLLELLTREEQRLKWSSNPRVLLEALAIKMARLADLTPLEDLITRLERGGPAPSAGAGPDRTRRAAGTDPGHAVAPPPAAPPPVPPVPPVPSASSASSAPEGHERGAAAWVEAILRRVQEERAALGGVLSQASWVEIAEGALWIAFDDRHSIFREKVESRDTADYLRKAAQAVCGLDLRIRAVSTAAVSRPAPDPGPRPPAGGPPGDTVPRAAAGEPARAAAPEPAVAETADARKRRLQDEALREPLVKSVLETFGARIIDVDPA